MSNPLPPSPLRTDRSPTRFGFGRLRFEATLESEFQRQQIDQTRLRLRTGAWFLLTVLVAFMVADLYRLRSAMHAGTWLHIGAILALRIAPMTPVFVALVMLRKSGDRTSEDLLRSLAVVALSLLGLSTLAVLILHFQRPDLAHVPFSLNGLTLVVLAYFFPSGIPYRTSLFMAAGLTLTTLIVMPVALPQSVMPSFYVFAPYMALTTIIAGVAGLLHEMTQRRQFLLERQLRYAAERDTLTALFNRGTFMLLCEQSAAAARRTGMTLSLLLVDIDHFKAYNDHYGHPAGDAALAAVAKTLSSVGSRDVDLAARLGGEEFAVMLYGTPALQAEKMAEAFRLRVQNELALDHAGSTTHKHLTVSVGVAALGPRMSIATLYKLADEALYIAKASGRNRVALNAPELPETGEPHGVTPDNVKPDNSPPETGKAPDATRRDNAESFPA